MTSSHKIIALSSFQGSEKTSEIRSTKPVSPTRRRYRQKKDWGRMFVNKKSTAISILFWYVYYRRTYQLHGEHIKILWKSTDKTPI